jgi:hypothetical protein
MDHAKGAASNTSRFHRNTKRKQVMNSPIRKIAATALLALAAMIGNQAGAVPIAGTINFGGGGALLNGSLASATQITAIDNEQVSGGLASPTGSYAGLIGDTVVYTTPLVFNPFSGSVTSLWTVTVGSVVYSFDITTLTIAFQSSYLLDLEGQGTANIVGSSTAYNATSGTWTIQVTGASTILSFQSTAAVPDSGTTAMLIGVGLVGTALASRRFKKSSKSVS